MVRGRLESWNTAVLQCLVRVLRFSGRPKCGNSPMESEELKFLQVFIRGFVISRASRMYGNPYEIIGNAVSARFHKGCVDPRASRM